MISKFFWYDVMADDVQKVEAFYRTVIGWTTEAAPFPGGEYTVFSTQGAGVAGLMETPPNLRERNIGSMWTGYIWAADVDATVARVVAAGGSVRREPWDVPEVGRMAVVADPAGAVFMLMCPFSVEARPTLPPETPGTIDWHELPSIDPARDFAFYSGLFAWTAAGEHDMGEAGKYLMFAVDGQTVGGIYGNDDIGEGGWRYYFFVDGIRAAAERIEQAGGKLIDGPQQVPGGNWILRAADPLDGVFALTSRRE